MVQRTPSASSVSISTQRDNQNDPEKDTGGNTTPDEEAEQQNATQDPEKGELRPTIPPDPNDWNGPNDPENPLNWNKWSRWYHVIPPALASFTGYGSTIF